MDTFISPFDFLILALATWRLSSLLADEDGSFGTLERLRTWLGVRYVSDDGNGVGIRRYVPDDTPTLKRAIARGVICRWCNSVWFGALLSVLAVTLRDVQYWHTAMTALFLSLAVSTAAILVGNSSIMVRLKSAEY